MASNDASLALFAAHPLLAEKLPHVSLCEFPTPLEVHEVEGKRVLVKRDDQTATRYGGNKVRKLEFALGAAQQAGAKEVLTFGFAGSNSATACAIYSKQLGMRSISMLLPQPSEEYVRHNLLQSFAAGAELHLRSNTRSLALATVAQLLRHGIQNRRLPAIVPAGVSSPLGVLGYVNAAFELAAQLREQGLAAPRRVYIAMGTGGTAAGLLIGLQAAGLATEVVAVRVVEEQFCNRKAVVKLANKVVSQLRRHDRGFLPETLDLNRLHVIDEQFGEGYGVPTKATNAAIDIADASGLKLDVTYTGKAFAQLLAEQKGAADGRSLFWLTKSASEIPKKVLAQDYRSLPKPFWEYFSS